MAKRRKVSEEFDFKFPEFDEKKYIDRERRNTKVVITTFIFSVVIALISRYLWAGMDKNIRWPLIFLFALFMIPFLYSIIRKIVDVSDYEKKNWFATYLSYLITWVVILIILVNPPFYDGTAPMVDYCILPIYQEPGGTVKVAAYIADNSGLKNVNLSVEEPGGEIVYPSHTTYEGLYIWEYKNSKNLMGRFNITITAEDTTGNRKVVKDSFWYSEDAIALAYPDNGSKVNHATPIRFEIKELSKENFLTYYIVDGHKINLTRSNNLYETSPIYEGWEKGKNVTLVVKAEVMHYFYDKKVNNTVSDSSVYVFPTDSNDNSIGTEKPPEFKEKLPSPRPRAITPGFEILVAVLSLILVAVWKKKR